MFPLLTLAVTSQNLRERNTLVPVCTQDNDNRSKKARIEDAMRGIELDRMSG